MSKLQSEENDIPFIKNDMKARPGTMGRALDTADAPGKADSEMGEEEVAPQAENAANSAQKGAS